jgi:hypothetical protein
MSGTKEALIDHLDSVFNGPAWHGAALLPTLRELEFARAANAGYEEFTPWGILLHCAYWKFWVRRAISSADQPPTFGRTPDDFPDLPTERTPETLEIDIQFLIDEHSALRDAVLAFPGARLSDLTPKGEFTFAGLIAGAAAHDAYHAAQIRNMGVQEFGNG